MKKKFDSILVANRGEIAVRIIYTAKKMGYRTVAVYSEEDIRSLHVDMADDSYCIGPAPVDESYLSIENIIKAAKDSGVGAIHPGYGFLSENYLFASACQKEKICFIGPSAESIKIMGNKAESKRRMIKASVPCIPGYQGKDQSLKKLILETKNIGFPIMVKAADGGGGKGMRLVEHEKDLRDSIISAQSEAKNSFGSKELILEKAIIGSRHIEVQIFSDDYGNCIHLGERDCSIQRRHQKIIEESPSPAVDTELRSRMGAIAVQVAKSINYSGAGTVEFLLDRNKDFYFLEMNTRLQVEHPVTEMVTGLDLVELQIHNAHGNKLELCQDDISFKGHSIEARLYAENPEEDFLPMTGKVELWKQSNREDSRTDNGVKTGQMISPYYDPMIAKIISWGKDRDSARINLQKTIDETIIFGVPTNKLFLSEVLKNNIFTKGKATTSFIAEEIRGFNYSINQPQPVYCLLAAVIQYIIDCENIWSKSIIVSEELVNWSSGNSLMSRFSFMVGTDDFSVSVSPKSNSTYDARIKDFSKIIEVVKKEAHMIVLIADNKKYEINYFLSENRLLFINLDGNNLEFLNKSSSSGFNINNDSNGILSSPMHGKLLDILVKKGSKVVKGMPLVIIEAMKMQHQIEAESEGVVNEIFVNPGKQVVSDQKILEIHLDKQKKKL